MELEGIWELRLLLKSPLVVDGTELPCSIMSRCLDYMKSCLEVVVGKEIEKLGGSIHFNIKNEAKMGKTWTHSCQTRASRAFHVTLGMTFQAGKADGSLIRLNSPYSTRRP